MTKCPLLLAFLALMSKLLWTTPAEAYTYESLVGEGCHERMVTTALRRVRQQLASAAPLPTGADDRLLINDLPFTLADDMRDIGAASLLVGVRDNDVKGFSGIDTSALPHVHAKPDHQREHCLRQAQHDEPDGSVEALRDCRAFIEEMVTKAVRDGLDQNGYPDPELRQALQLQLTFSGPVNAEFPTFYLKMGQALHALQDSFTHGFRTADSTHITVLLNWVDVLDDLVEERDGPPHLGKLDLCADLDDFLKERWSVALDASTELLLAALDPELELDEKRAAAKQTLDKYMSFEPGCTYENDWCDAVENHYRSGCSCQTLGTTPTRVWWWPLISLFALIRRKTKICS